MQCLLARPPDRGSAANIVYIRRETSLFAETREMSELLGNKTWRICTVKAQLPEEPQNQTRPGKSDVISIALCQLY